MLATEFDDNSMTESGYARSVRLLRRGQALNEAEMLFQVDPSHMILEITSFKTRSKRHLFFVDRINFYQANYYFVSDQTLQQYCLPIPLDAEVIDVFRGVAIVKLKSDWTLDLNTTFKTDDIVSFDLEKFSRAPSLSAQELNFQLLVRPESGCAFQSLTSNEDALFLTILNNVCGELIVLKPHEKSFVSKKLPLIENGDVNVKSLSVYHDEVIISAESFITPETLFSYDSRTDSFALLKKGKQYFNPDLYQVTQHGAMSEDGTLLPYHMIARKDFQRDGTNPTLLYGYGGFASSSTPGYLDLNGINLLEKGFVYVQANIRGGGEFGENWAKAGRKELKQKSFDDFIAVAGNLISRGVTSPQFLGIEGGSNGGLLVGACVVQQPQLFGAVLCEVPLLDMLCYHTLLAGDSWVEEYGDPEHPEMKAVLGW